MLSIRAVKQEIIALSKDTTDFKKTRFDTLLRVLNEIDSDAPLKRNAIPDLLTLCKGCLDNPQFTYKKISLFGFLTSRSEKLVRKLINVLTNNKIDLLIDKLDDISDLDRNNLRTAIKDKNYRNAYGILNHNQKPLNVAQEISFTRDSILNWLNECISLQIDLAGITKIYSGNTLTKLLDESFDQAILDLHGLTRFMQNQPIDTVTSFIYVLDTHGNIFFSPNAEASRHRNVNEEKDAHFAGEIYLRRTANGIELTKLNNKSAFYKPGIELFNTLKDWFNSNGYHTNKTMFDDARTHEMTNYICAVQAFR